MHREESLSMFASSNGGRKRKAPEGREMTHSPPPPGFPIPLYQRAGAGAPPPFNLQLRLDQPGAPPPRFPTTPTQQMAPPPLNLQLHLDQAGASSSVAQQPYFDTVLRLSVTPQTEQGFKRQYAAEEEKAAKKLTVADKEIEEVRTRNSDLEAMLASYRTEATTTAERLKALEETNAALNAALHEIAHRRATPQGRGAGEEAQSSSFDPDQVVVVRISCKICWRGPATMVAWPCRHLCLCNNCERTTNRCPIWDATFQNCIQVKFY